MKTNQIRLGRDRRITLPREAVRLLRVRKGAQFVVTVSDESIILMPVSRIPRDQLWFWTPEWQAMEREADAGIKAGRFQSFGSVEELIRSLRRA